MIYKYGSFTEAGGRLEYTIFVNDPLIWGTYTAVPGPRLFIVVDSLEVPTSQRGQGVGIKLIDRVVKLCCQMGIRHICLWADFNKNPDVVSWYKKLGFFESAMPISGMMQPMIAQVAGDYIPIEGTSSYKMLN